MRSLHGCFLNQRPVEFSRLYTTRSSDLTFKQYGRECSSLDVSEFREPRCADLFTHQGKSQGRRIRSLNLEEFLFSALKVLRRKGVVPIYPIRWLSPKVSTFPGPSCHQKGYGLGKTVVTWTPK